MSMSSLGVDQAILSQIHAHRCENLEIGGLQLSLIDGSGWRRKHAIVLWDRGMRYYAFI